MRQSPGSCLSCIFLAVSASATVFHRFSIACGRAQRARGSRAGPTQRPHNVPQNATHNVYTTSYTTSAQRLHNVRTMLPGLIPKEKPKFADRRRAPQSRELRFLHISDRFCLCAPFPSLFQCFWARPAGAGPAHRSILSARSWFREAGSQIFVETVSYKLVLRSRIPAFCRDCQPKAGSEKQTW